MPVPETRPLEPIAVRFIDYDLTLNCGRDFSFSLRPDDGDTALHDKVADTLTLWFAKTKHHVAIVNTQIAVLSVRERTMAFPVSPDKKTWPTTTTTQPT